MSRHTRFTLALAAAAACWSSAVAAPLSLPCDIYASGNSPCVAAHSSTRALYGSYKGPLYQVLRNSDNATIDISPMTAGGVADASAQDSFCTGSTCYISVIYDQSGHGNDLTRAPGGAVKGPQLDHSDNLASAFGAPVTVNGHKAYGVFIPPGTGYRNDHAKDTATGDGAEAMYAVLDGSHYNDKCCMDYGNAETSNTDTGAGHMEALYFGRAGAAHGGDGNGPWIMADLEDGLFAGVSKKEKNKQNPSQKSRFITAILKGKPDYFSLRGGDARTGSLTTYYSGERPVGYKVMHEEGSIILGIGGDNNHRSQGTFYEGVMLASYPSDSTEDAVQANIVAAKYETAPLNSGTALKVGSNIALHVTTPGHTTKYISHDESTIRIEVVSESSSKEVKDSASWTVRPGLANKQCFTFESVAKPGFFIRQANWKLVLDEKKSVKKELKKEFGEDATFCTQPGLNGQGDTFRSWAYPSRHIRHFLGIGHLASQGGPEFFDAYPLYADDVSFKVESTSFG